jgi:methylase of polypeptide subunit release factors
MSGGAYISSEDSALLRSALQGLSGESCLEIGAGNCGTLLDLKRRFELVVGTDLLRPATSDWRGKGIEFVLTDAASCFRPFAFDLVAFNPPYLAVEVSGDRAVEGGEDLEVPQAFLREALRTVKRTGKIVFLLNDEADVSQFEDMCSEKSFVLTPSASKRMFFEELVTYSAAAIG